jgi:hypothetical protein
MSEFYRNILTSTVSLVIGQQAIAGNAAWKQWQFWQRWHIVFCNLQNQKGGFGNESHSLRQDLFQRVDSKPITTLND